MNEGDITSYIESLCKSRELLKNSELLNKLDNVISLELELALQCAERELSELRKSTKDNVRPIK